LAEPTLIDISLDKERLAATVRPDMIGQKNLTLLVTRESQ
jgi:hypothetical protein